jgi:hypothetical protein
LQPYTCITSASIGFTRAPGFGSLAGYPMGCFKERARFSAARMRCAGLVRPPKPALDALS